MSRTKVKLPKSSLAEKPMTLSVARRLHTPMDFICMLVSAFLPIAAIIAGMNGGTTQALVAIFMATGMHAAVMMMIWGLRLSEKLPPIIGIWFEEASLILEHTGAHRYQRPFSSIGESAITCVSTACVAAWQVHFHDYDGSWLKLYPIFFAAIVNCGLAMRTWRRTRDQYKRKFLVYEKQVPDHEIVAQQVSNRLMSALEPLVAYSACALSPELLNVKTEVAIHGAPRALRFVFETLQRLVASQEDADVKQLSLTKKENPFDCVPLYRRWQMLQEAGKVGRECLRQTTETGAKWVSGRKRELLSRLTSRAEALADCVRSLAVDSSGGAAVTEMDVVAALVKTQRNCLQQVRGKVQSSKLKHGTDSEEDTRNPEEMQCVCCFDAIAEFVFIGCGHLCYCRSCRKQAIRLVCPLCRGESKIVERSKFKGRLFVT